MQLIDNTYQIADGYFISNCIGEKAFEAENLIFPPLTILICVGLMFGTGSSALIAKELGEGKKEGNAQGTVLCVRFRSRKKRLRPLFLLPFCAMTAQNFSCFYGKYHI